MSANLTALLYLAASICFIMALRGLSSPVTSRAGNIYGIVGMVVAIVTTVMQPGVVSYSWIVAGIVVGGAVGTFIALRIQMTALPQLVAAFHSLVGLAAVCVATAALWSPADYGILGENGIRTASLVEMSIGTAIGAITFTGSVIAFGKLQGLITGAPLVFKGQHPLNALLGLALVVIIVWFCSTGEHVPFWLLVALSLLLGLLIIVPIGGADMPVVISMLNSYSGWAACGIGFTLAQQPARSSPGALVGSSGAILSYIMCKGMNRSIFNVILGGFGTEGGAAAAAHGHGGPAGQVRLGRRRRLHHEERPVGHHRAGLWHGGGAGAARAARDGRPAQGRGHQGALRHPPGRGPHARPHERAARRGQRAL